jgi:AcrR family transcriptional regulator
MPTSAPASYPKSARSQPRREHLVEIAQVLFNANGFYQTGIDMIMRESGVSKTTLYKYFPSKEDLVLEVLKLRSARIRGGMAERLGWLLAASPNATAAERIEVIIEVIQEWVEGNSFFGCNFVRAAAEYSVPGNPIAQQAREHKLALQRLIAEQLNCYPPIIRDRLASEILLIIEGAIAVAQMGSSHSPIQLARRLIGLLLMA